MLGGLAWSAARTAFPLHVGSTPLLGLPAQHNYPGGAVLWDHPTLPADVAVDIADAEAAVRALNDTDTRYVSLEGLARFLLRAESVGSSRVEGLAAASRRLASAEAALALGGDPADRVAVEVLGNVAAMESAIELAAAETRFDEPSLLRIHRTLTARSSTP